MKYFQRKATLNKSILFKLVLLVGAVALITTQAAWAVGTESGTEITNRATIDYSVGAVSQTPIESSPTGNATPGIGQGGDTSFLVDNRVDLTVASLGDTNVIPGSVNMVLAFSITNTGNTTQGYAVAVVDEATGIPMNNVRIYLDANNDGALDGGDTLYTAGSNIGNLNPNGTIGTDDVMQVLIVADTPSVAADGTSDTYWLLATTLNTDGSVTAETNAGAADDPNAVDVVFGDGESDDGGSTDSANNGQHADSGVFAVATANLTVQKTSEVFSDPIVGTSPNAKAIPGAQVRYTITIENTGSVIAEGVTISDEIDQDVAFLTGTVLINGADGSGQTTITAGPPDTISIDVGDVGGGTTTTVTFDVEIP